jgi:phi13 family phage major tail protein
MAQNLMKSISKIGYAMATVTDTAVTYDKVVWLPTFESGGREYSAEPNGEVTEVYADGICVYSQEDNNGYDISLTLLAITDNIEANWYGFDKTTDKAGIAEYANNGVYPYFALIICEDTTDGTGKTTIYYYTKINKRPTKSGKTTEGKVDFQFPQYDLASRPRSTDRLVRWSFEGQELFDELPEPTNEKKSA